MAVTMKDIAKHCGVSGGSVSQVLRNPENPRFTPETRKLILETAAKLEYRQNPLSRALRTNKTNLLGLMLPWNEPEIMDCIERVASENGYKLLIQFTAHPRAGMEMEALRSFIDWNVDGIIWEPSSMTNDDFLPLLKKIKQEGPPLVMLERGIDGIHFPLVETDYAPAINKCMKHLKEQGYGKAAFVFDINRSGLLDNKLNAIHEAAAGYQLDFDSFWISQNDMSRQDGLREILTKPENANTAYFCYAWLTADLVEAMESLNMRAPEDIGIIMLIDMLIAGRLRVSNLLRPKITAIRTNSRELAELAVNRLLAEIQQGKPKESPQYYDTAELVFQQSTIRYK